MWAKDHKKHEKTQKREVSFEIQQALLKSINSKERNLPETFVIYLSTKMQLTEKKIQKKRKKQKSKKIRRCPKLRRLKFATLKRLGINELKFSDGFIE